MSDLAFSDDFSDGDYTDNWEIYLDQGDFSAEVVAGEEEADGDNMQLSISETTGGGTRGVIGWTEEMEGWDQQWTLRGEFYTEEISTNVPFQQHSIYPAYRPADGSSGEDRSLVLICGFSDGSNDIIPFRVDGDFIETIEKVYEFDWQEDTWYNYKLVHDGDGRYTAKLWTGTESESDEPDAISVGETPPAESRVAAIQVNGGRREPLQVQHGSMGWTGGQTQESPEITKSVSTVQFIPGREENVSLGGDPLNSGLMQVFEEDFAINTSDLLALPFPVLNEIREQLFFEPILDSWFYGDMSDTDRIDIGETFEEANEKVGGKYRDALGLEEHKKYRFQHRIEVSFESSNGSIDSDTVEITFNDTVEDPDDEKISVDSFESPDTVLVAAEGEDVNNLPVDEWFGSDLKRKTNQEQRYYYYEDYEFNGVDGIRVLSISGGYVGFADTITEQASDDAAGFLDEIFSWNLPDLAIDAVRLTNGALNKVLEYTSVVPRTWSFIEFIVLADGRHYARVWDASQYPSLYTYLDGERQATDDMTYEPQEEFNGPLLSFFARAAAGMTPYQTIPQFYLWNLGGGRSEVLYEDTLEENLRTIEKLNEFNVSEWMPMIPRETVAGGPSDAPDITDPTAPFGRNPDVLGFLLETNRLDPV